MDADQVPPQLAMVRLIFAGWSSQALRAMALLGLADHLTDGPRAVDELADAASVDPGALERLIDLLAALGLCERVDRSAKVALTPVGSLLRSDRPDSLRAVASLMTAPWVMRVWEALPDSIRTGTAVFDDVHGVGFWEYLTANPDKATEFDAGMTGGAEQRAMAIVEACDLTEVTTVVDVGGGQGRLLAALLVANPHLRGVVADRPEVLAGAGAILTNAGIGDRCEVAPTDFFRSVPAGGDVYVLAQIIHDWPDDEALAILRVCAEAMAPGTKLLVIEQVLPDRDAPDLMAALADINMLVLLGAQERNAEGYRALLDHAGFTTTAVRPTRGRWTIVEATKR